MSLTKVSYSMISSEGVSTRDFGAKGDGVTNDSAAIQLAIDYCLANGKDLIVSGLCHLEQSLNITRGETANFAKYFTIRSDDGGGFFINTAIPMFSSTAAYTVDPVAFLINFQNLLFKGTAGANEYFLHDGRYGRLTFNMCSFQSVKFASVTAGRIQSVYFNSCQGRYSAGRFLYTSTYTYDLKVDGCLFEAGAEWFYLKNADSVAFTNTCLEGSLTATPITVDFASGLVITGNYFEQQLNHILLTGDQFSTVVTSNYFINATSGYSVVWPAHAFKCIANGNYGNDTNHYLEAGSQVNILDYSVGPGVSNIVPTTYATGALYVDRGIVNLGAIGQSDTAMVLELASSKFAYNDSRDILVNTDFINIAMGTTGGAVKINIVCSAVFIGVGYASQVSEWAVTRAGTGAFTITAINSTHSGVSAPVVVGQSGDNILISYVYTGPNQDRFWTTVEILARTGDINRIRPVVTLL